MRRYFAAQQGEKRRQCGALASKFNKVEVQNNKPVKHKPLAIEYIPANSRHGLRFLPHVGCESTDYLFANFLLLCIFCKACLYLQLHTTPSREG